MPTYQTRGIVIGRTNFGEADRIVRLLTPEHGKLSTVAKGVRRVKSRLGGHLELFGEVELMLATGRNLDVITSARLLWYPHQLAGAYDRLGLAFMFATAIDRLTDSGQPQPKLYETLLQALRTLDETGAGPTLELWFKLQLTSALGYRPELSGCIVCGRHDEATSYYFDPARGGIVCHSDASATSKPIATAAIKFWRLLLDYPYATIANIANGTQLSAATLPLADEFFEHHLGRAFHA